MSQVDELYVPPDGKPSGEADRVAVFANGPGSLAARLQVALPIGSSDRLHVTGCT